MKKKGGTKATEPVQEQEERVTIVLRGNRFNRVESKQDVRADVLLSALQEARDSVLFQVAGRMALSRLQERALQDFRAMGDPSIEEENKE